MSSTPTIRGDDIVQPNNGQVATMPSRYQYYPPAPSSTSSIYSEWLLNFPGLRTDIPPLPLDVIQNLDYRLRYTD